MTLAPPTLRRSPLRTRGATILPAKDDSEPARRSRGAQHQAVQNAPDLQTARDDLVLLRLYSEILADLQTARIAFSNRVGANAIIDKGWAADRVKAFEREERAVGTMVEATFLRSLPATAQWVADTPGLGMFSVGRLVGTVGHPRVASPARYEPNPVYDADKPSSRKNPTRILVADEPYERTVSQLWSYCGVGDPRRKRSRGMSQDEALAAGNPQARVLLFRIMDVALKSRRFGSPYAAVYDELRGRYAAEGWGESDKHRHLSALRIAGKRFLRDLWITSGLDLAPAMGRPTPIFVSPVQEAAQTAATCDVERPARRTKPTKSASTKTAHDTTPKGDAL